MASRELCQIFPQLRAGYSRAANATAIYTGRGWIWPADICCAGWWLWWLLEQQSVLLGKRQAAALDIIRDPWMWIITAKLLLGRFCHSEVEQCLISPVAPWAASDHVLRESDPPAQDLPGIFPWADALTAPKDLLQAIRIDRESSHLQVLQLPKQVCRE